MVLHSWTHPAWSCIHGPTMHGPASLDPPCMVLHSCPPGCSGVVLCFSSGLSRWGASWRGRGRRYPCTGRRTGRPWPGTPVQWDSTPSARDGSNHSASTRKYLPERQQIVVLLCFICNSFGEIYVFFSKRYGVHIHCHVKNKEIQTQKPFVAGQWN